MSRTYSVEGIVLYRINFSDADRIVTMYTREQGKISLLAKGARKTSSRKKGSLEPATHAQFYCARGKSLDILTQSQIIKSYANNIQSLKRVTQLNQVLEITNLLTVENQENPEVFDTVVSMLAILQSPGPKKQFLLEKIRLLLLHLGFTHDKQFSETSLKDYIEEISQKSLRSKKFLTPISI